MGITGLKGSFMTSFTGGVGGNRGESGGMASAAAEVAAGFDRGDSISDPSLDGSIANHYGPSTRYDPQDGQRIGDINDLKDDDDGSASGTEEGTEAIMCLRSEKDKRRRLGRICKIAAVSLALTASLAAAIVAATNPRTNPFRSASPNPGASLQLQRPETPAEQRLRVAQQVVAACGSSRLDEGMDECQALCAGRMCCFERVGGKYGCRDDADAGCPEYAACEALVRGVMPGKKVEAVAVEERRTDKRARWG